MMKPLREIDMLLNYFPRTRRRGRLMPVSQAALTAALLATALPATLPAAGAIDANAPIASVAPRGDVRVGEAESQIASAQPLTRGEAIRTGADGLAAIQTWHDGRLEVRPGSHARLHADRLELRSGAAASAGLPIRLDDVDFAPEGSGEHWFAVGARDGRTIVAAHEGNVAIRRSGARSIVVPAGSYAFPSPRDSAKEDDEDEDRKAVGGAGRTAQPPASANGGWTIGSLTHGQSMLLVGGVAAVGATGVVAGVAANDPAQPARSPSR